MAINTGVNASKLVGFLVQSIPAGVDVTKVTGYVVLGSLPSVPPAWPSFSFVDGTRTVAYSQSFTPTGTTPITVTVASGSLPTGLSLSLVTGSTYKISGTPTVSGTFSFSLAASSTWGSATQSFTITINPVLPAWPTFTFADGVVGLAYSQQFTPAGSPMVTLLSGSLPAGLSLSLVSGSTYKISGTPTTPGTSTFTLRASNVDGNADQSFSITINAAAGGGGGSYCFAA